MTLVEGSISTPEQEARIREIREASRILITIGACATAGGIQALRNATGRHGEFVRTVYPTPEYVRSLEDPRPIAHLAPVDLELTGCWIDRGELLFTRTGCGAPCPAFGRGCYGCLGPAEAPGNAEALERRFIELGLSPREAADRFRSIPGWAPAFREAASRLRAPPRKGGAG